MTILQLNQKPKSSPIFFSRPKLLSFPNFEKSFLQQNGILIYYGFVTLCLHTKFCDFCE